MDLADAESFLRIWKGDLVHAVRRIGGKVHAGIGPVERGL